MSLERLLAAPLFDGAPHAALERLYRRGAVVAAEPGRILIQEGAINRSMYVILSGELEIRLAETPERFSAVRLASRQAGDCIGEYSFLGQRGASATVVVARPAELFEIAHEDFNSVLASSPDLERTVYRNLIVSLVDRLRANDADIDLLRPL